MRQAIRRQPSEITINPPKKSIKIFSNIIFGGIVVIAILMALSLLTYHPEDSAWSKTFETAKVHNWLGARGAFFSDIAFTAIGQAAWLIPILLIAYGYRLICQKGYQGLDIETVMIRILGIVLLLLAIASLLNVYNPNDDVIEHGGAIGQLVGTLLSHSVGWLHNLFPDSFVSVTIMKLILFGFLFMTTIMATGCGPLAWIDAIGAIIIRSFEFIAQRITGKTTQNTHESEFADIEHLMQRAPDAEPTPSKPSFLSKLVKHKPFSTQRKTAEPDNLHEQDDLDHSNESPSAHIKTNTHKVEPSLSFNDHATPKHEPSFASTSMSTPTPPKFEVQMDEHGQPKVPSIFKRPTIKSSPQDDLSAHEDSRVKNLSAWANDHSIDDQPKEETVFNFSTSTAPQQDFEVTEESPSPISLDDKPETPIISHQETSMFSQSSSVADDKSLGATPSMNLEDDEQDFDAFIESLEKYHPPKFAMTTNAMSDATSHIISEEPEITPYFSTSESTPDLDLPLVSEEILMDEMDNLPTFEMIAPDSDTQSESIIDDAALDPSVEPALLESTPEPTWSPIEPTLDYEPEFEPLDSIPEPIPMPKPIENIIITPPKRPVLMDENRQAELLKHFPMAGQLPPLNLLGDPPPSYNQYDVDELNDMAQLIEEQLKNFSIKVQVANIEPGPVVTRFELDLAPGVKVAQINNLEKDIARGLSVTSVRVVDIIPGTSYVGLEIPNRKREIVYFKSGLESQEYQDATDPLTLILGKSISGEPVLANLAKMPHVLVAGTTGSGKSVGVNTMLLSMLFKARPDELRLILIDPKMLELSVYNDIPHLLIPVITDMKESANALRWCVAEMERRYMLMSQLKVRNIAGFNQKVQEAIDKGEPIIDPTWRRSEHVSDTQNPPLLEKLPFIVVVIDEFADMMMLVGKKCEELIARLAQKARASGIHLILATQRPSVDVITGLIKANIPTRIAFQVSSKIDSRTIIDQQGAETLLGHGDMLYAPSGVNVPIRVHGAFVDDHEVNKVAEFLKLTGEPDYIEDILQEPTEAIPGLSPEASGVAATLAEEQDPLFDEAVKIVVESRRASISFIQRKLRVGYQRAARLMEEMEELRIVTPPQSNGNREVLMAADNDDY